MAKPEIFFQNLQPVSQAGGIRIAAMEHHEHEKPKLFAVLARARGWTNDGCRGRKNRGPPETGFVRAMSPMVANKSLRRSSERLD